MTLTQDDCMDAKGVGFDLVAIEEANGCTGEICGACPELILPPDMYMDYVERMGGERPAAEHSHLVVSRAHPAARRYFSAISK